MISEKQMKQYTIIKKRLGKFSFCLAIELAFWPSSPAFCGSELLFLEALWPYGRYQHPLKTYKNTRLLMTPLHHEAEKIPSNTSLLSERI